MSQPQFKVKIQEIKLDAEYLQPEGWEIREIMQSTNGDKFYVVLIKKPRLEPVELKGDKAPAPAKNA